MLTTKSLPVSKKFYQERVERINTSFSSMGSDQSSQIAVTTAVFNYYFLNGSLVHRKVDAIVELVLSLLKPEIDKAIKRSSAGRRRREHEQLRQSRRAARAKACVKY